MATELYQFTGCCGAAIAYGMSRPTDLPHLLEKARKSGYSLVFACIADWQDGNDYWGKATQTSKFIQDLKDHGAFFTPYYHNPTGSWIMGVIIPTKDKATFKKDHSKDNPPMVYLEEVKKKLSLLKTIWTQLQRLWKRP